MDAQQLGLKDFLTMGCAAVGAVLGVMNTLTNRISAG